MQNNDRNPNVTVSDGLYRYDHPDSDIFLPRPVRESNVSTLGDYIRHLQESDKQSDKPSVPSQPIESNFEHICPNNPILTCNCADPNACAELGDDPDSQHRDSESRNKDRYPSNDGFSDNINYTGISTAKGESKVSGWPCVVIGAICETRVDPAECISRSPDSSGFAK